MSQFGTPPPAASQSAAAAAAVQAGAPGLHFAGFWIRFAAILVDGAILLTLSYAVGLIVLLLAMGRAGTPGETMFVMRISAMLTHLVVLIASIVYYVGFLSGPWQATPGKRLFGIYVMTKDGRRLTVLHAIGRYFAYLVSFLTLYVGFFIAGWTREHTALHDIICGTRVVYGRKDRAPA